MRQVFLIYLAIVNAIAFILYGIDKYKAKKSRWRIKESILIGIAVIGGGVGALAGMYLFHHKTRKPLFYLTVPLFVVLYVLFCYFVLQ